MDGSSLKQLVEHRAKRKKETCWRKRKPPSELWNQILKAVWGLLLSLFSMSKWGENRTMGWTSCFNDAVEDVMEMLRLIWQSLSLSSPTTDVVLLVNYWKWSVTKLPAVWPAADEAQNEEDLRFVELRRKKNQMWFCDQLRPGYHSFFSHFFNVQLSKQTVPK